MSKTSKTDWEHLAKLNDQDIDTSEIPELSEDFFRGAELRLPAMGPWRLESPAMTPSPASQLRQGIAPGLNRGKPCSAFPPSTAPDCAPSHPECNPTTR